MGRNRNEIIREYLTRLDPDLLPEDDRERRLKLYSQVIRCIEETYREWEPRKRR